VTSPLLSLQSAVRVQLPRPVGAWLDHTVSYGPFVLLLFGPLAFGSVEPWSIFVLEAGAAALFAFWLVGQVKGCQLEITGCPLFPPMLVFAALVAIQLVSRHTAYSYATRSQGMLYVAYGTLCFVVVQSLLRTRQIKRLAFIFSAYGFAVATFALVFDLSSNGKLYWLRTIRNGGWIYGPYVNHNHYAGLMEMLIPIPLVFALSNYARGSRKYLAALAAALMATTVFLSGSRGGMLAFTVEMCVLGAVLAQRRASKRAAWLLGGFLVVVLGLLAWLGGGEVTARLATINSEARRELSGGTRVSIGRDGLKMWSQRPFLGWGLGTFREVYPQFRSFYTDLVVDEAHDDYLQLLTETGVAGLAVLVWFLVVLYRSAALKLTNWPRDTNGAVALAAILGCTGILVHSFVDFNLQVPANAGLFYVLAVVAALPPRFGVYRRKEHAASEDVAATFSGIKAGSQC
jgi:O-antigen ligase